MPFSLEIKRYNMFDYTELRTYVCLNCNTRNSFYGMQLECYKCKTRINPDMVVLIKSTEKRVQWHMDGVCD